MGKLSDLWGPHWVCPDCTTDLARPVKHPGDWGFCPKTGREQGLKHMTPQRLQELWDRVWSQAGQLGVERLLGALLSEVSKMRSSAPSYLGGTETRLLEYSAGPDEPVQLARDMAELMLRRSEWLHHLTELLQGRRHLARYDRPKALRSGD